MTTPFDNRGSAFLARQACLDHVGARWTDPRPRSLVEAVGE